MHGSSVLKSFANRCSRKGSGKPGLYPF